MAAPRPERKRQARGEERIRQILHAAAEVFAEKGYESATTNAIATRAGISPGSLYQYFSGKDAIAAALAEYYAAGLATLREASFAPAVANGPTSLERTIDAILDPLIEFNLAHPGFKALFSRTDMPADLREAVGPVQEAIHSSVAELVAAYGPRLGPQDVRRTATVAVQIVRGMVPLVADAPDTAGRRALTAELRTALLAYLHAVLGE